MNFKGNKTLIDSITFLYPKAKYSIFEVTDLNEVLLDLHSLAYMVFVYM